MNIGNCIEAVNIGNCIEETNDVNSLYIVVDFDNRQKSLEASIRAGNSFISVTVDTGSPSSFLNKRTAEKLLADPEAGASMIDPSPELQSRYIDYNKNFIQFLIIWVQNWKKNILYKLIKLISNCIIFDITVGVIT